MMSEPNADTRAAMIEADAIVKHRYKLAELLAQSDYSYPPTAEEREWLDAPPVRREFGAEGQVSALGTLRQFASCKPKKGQGDVE